MASKFEVLSEIAAGPAASAKPRQSKISVVLFSGGSGTSEYRGSVAEAPAALTEDPD